MKKHEKFLKKSVEICAEKFGVKGKMSTFALPFGWRTAELIEMMIKDKQHIQKNMYSVQERKYVKVYYNER